MSRPAAAERKPALGADLVIPLLSLGFAAYFFVSIADLGWEAKANGVVIGSALVVLSLVQLARIGIRLARGTGDWRFDPLLLPRAALGRRVGLVVVTIAFLATLRWLGLGLGLFLGMAASLRVMGVRRPRVVLAISLAVAASADLLFIAVLNSAFPHGPVERAVAWLARLV